MNYIKINGERFDLTNDQALLDSKTLQLGIVNKDYSFDYLREIFSNLEPVIIVYGCIVQEDGRETDEYIANTFENFIILSKIEYDFDDNIYRVMLLYSDRVEKKLYDNEKRIESLEKALPPLTSPFTTNVEPTGVATRYYDVTELIAIYNENQPITVKVTTPISYKQPILLNLNCELYLGGN